MKNPFETEERAAFRETIRRFVAAEITPFVNEWDEAGGFPFELHAKVAELGAFGFGIDPQYGGLGFDDCFMRAAYAEEMGRCGASGMFSGLNSRLIAVGPIVELASEDMRQRVLPPVLSGEKVACLAITEASAGSDVANIKSTAKRQGDHYLLNGSKTFITGGMNSEYFVVAARTGGKGLHGISLFLLERGMPGFTATALERKMGWWCSDQATLYFDNVPVPAANLIGDEHHGFVAIMQNFNMERLAMTAASLGMMKSCLDYAVAWARERETFGKRLIEHQVIRHKIAEMSARIDAVEAYVNQICWAVNEGDLPVAEICKAKFFTTKALEYCASEAMQILGGAGYLRGNPVERCYREVKVMAIGGGSEEIMRDLAMRQMGL